VQAEHTEKELNIGRKRLCDLYPPLRIFITSTIRFYLVI
jgi:hypothetical protein